MTQPVDRNKMPDHPAGHAQLARDWWRDERFRQLPGEEGDHTVYVIDFYDRCKYFGYTREPVFYRAASLAARIANWGTNAFVEEHAARVPYAIRCIKSGLNDLQARHLRDMLVAQAPDNIHHAPGSVVHTTNCWLSGDTELSPPVDTPVDTKGA